MELQENMSTFDEREQGFEAKFSHDQEVAFKIEVRRNKLLGLWAAGLMGMDQAESEAYAQSLVSGTLKDLTIAGVTRRLLADFASHDVAMSEHRLSKQIEEMAELAREQIRGTL
jgi:hypothetical protein